MQANIHQERRRHIRRSAASACFLTRGGLRRPSSAWLMNLSAGGAAFLTPFEHTPMLGERVKISPMPTNSQFVRDATPAMPRYATVVRIEHPNEPTQSVAVRFDSPQPAALAKAIARASNARQRRSNPA